MSTMSLFAEGTGSAVLLFVLFLAAAALLLGGTNRLRAWWERRRHPDELTIRRSAKDLDGKVRQRRVGS
jgi:hypothetical protein